MTFDPFGDFETEGYLRNFAGFKDPALVKKFEHDAFRARVGEAVTTLQTGTPLRYEDILATHQRLFQDVYPWAGQDRTATAPDLIIGKGGRFDLFAEAGDIRRAAEHALRLSQNLETMRAKPGEVMGYLAHAHPFLDGNGRTIMLIHGEMCRRAEMHINWVAIPKRAYLSALTKEAVTPGRGGLDSLLRPHIRSRALTPAQEILTLRSMPGLGPRGNDPVDVVVAPAAESPAPSRVRDEPERSQPQRPELLPARTVDTKLSPDELAKRIAEGQRLSEYMTAVATIAGQVFKEPEPLVSNLIKQAVEEEEAIRTLRTQLYKEPESLGELKGGVSRFMRRDDGDRQAARAAAPALANAVSELAAAARSIKAELQADWSEFVQREQIAVPAPSEELQAVLAKGEMTATQVAEVARKVDLVSEINNFLDKAGQRFGRDGMAAIRGGRMNELRSRMSGIREHDLERAAKLTQDIAKLHDRVEQHQHKHARKQDQGRTLGPGSGGTA